MKARQLAVDGALEFTPPVRRDDRGLFVSVFEDAQFEAAHFAPLFDVAQVSMSRSARNVVRGVHYTVAPPGMSKYVYCAQGQALDIVVDLRLGSPTFGQWEAVLLDAEECRALYYPVDVGHAFVSLADDTVMCYLLSCDYRPADQRVVSALDPELGLPIPPDVEPTMSDRDRHAPTLAEAIRRGLLPDHHGVVIERSTQ